MKIIKSLRHIGILIMVLFSGTVLAYNPGSVDKDCKSPKFTDFVPPEKKIDTPVPEVEPESEIEFRVSGFADPTTITATAKDQPLKLNIEDKNSFYQASAILPAVLNGKYARINLQAKAQSGPCDTKDGWLIKIKKAAESVEPKVAE